MKALHFSRKQLCIPYAVFLICFVIMPMLLILFYAFTDKNGALTLNNFISFFSDMNKLNVLLVSLGYGLVTTVICLLIAYPLAYILARSNLKKKDVLILLFIMPMWINFVLRINALRELLSLIGLLNRYNEVCSIIGMVYDFLPFMILPLYTTLQKLDVSLLEAARDLGATKRQVFTKVTIPLSMPGILSGITMVFMPTMTNYVITDILGNSKVTILGKLIEEYFNKSYWNMGSMIAIILLVIVFVSMLLTGGFKTDSDTRGANIW